MSERLYANDYEFVEGLSGDACPRCGEPLEEWTEYVPCCGGEFECEDPIYCVACHRCRIEGSRF